MVAFHCQQAVEKALKAFLTLRAEPFEKTHDIGFLLDLCAPLDGEFETIRTIAAQLTDFATAFRYPGPMAPTRRHAESALASMEQVWSVVSASMPMGIVVD